MSLCVVEALEVERAQLHVDLSHYPQSPDQPTIDSLLERTGAVGSASDFGPRGPWFDPRPFGPRGPWFDPRQGRRLLWP